MKLILKGIGGCEGTSKGKVKIIKDIMKIPEIDKNCIIITPYFTPLITILLSKAKGLITDFGGITSHAAIVSREFNIPCIVGVNEATNVLKDSQEIFIDGKKGEIYEI